MTTEPIMHQYLIQNWWICLVVVLTFLFLLQIKSWFKTAYLALKLPGPPALPLIGNILLARQDADLVNIGRTMYTDYGPIFRVWLSIVPFIVISEPKDIQVILGNAKLTNKNFLYSFIHTFVGEGLTTNNGQKWKSHRKSIQPFFNLNIIETFLHTFVESAEILVKELKGNKITQITNSVNRCVLDILDQAILGIPIKDQEIKEQSPFRKGQLTLLCRIRKPWLLLDSVYKLTSTAKDDSQQKHTLRQFSKKIFEERKRNKELGLALPWCLLEFLMEIAESNLDFTEQDVIDEVSTFMLAGQDSVASGTCYALYYLAKHQDVQEKAVDELKSVFSQSNEINLETLGKMNYLQQCIKEALRLCPSIPMIARKLREDVRLGKHVLPAGCNVFITPFVTHRIPHYYPDPEKFDPDRFSKENCEKRNPFAFMSFSAGPRNCIGYKFALLEMKTIISTLLRNYRIFLAPEYEMKLQFKLTLKAKGGIYLRFEPRLNFL